MATGGIFQLITNDGKQDRMLMATDLLTQRLAAAKAARANQADPNPTLYDIERTHILFTNAHFKPFAAIGFEYNKVIPQGGSGSLGSTVTFSIPQFGDFFCDMVLHVILNQPQFESSYAAVDPSRQNLMRWCAYPGERLLENVKFDVNGNPLDEYDSIDVNFHREFQLQPNKELAWNRCMGQEEDEYGFLEQPNWEKSSVAGADVKHRTSVVSRSGLQTPTGQKTGTVELFIPLLFWCNKDPRLAVPSVAIPYGQRFISMKLAPAEKLVGEVPRGIPEGSEWTQTTIESGGKLVNANLVSTIELYINNIFVNPDVHNIFIQRVGFTLIRVHRRHFVEVKSPNGSTLLSNLKWPIEALFIGMRVNDYNTNSSDVLTVKKHLDKWYRFSQVKSEKRATQGWKSLKVSTTKHASMAVVFSTTATPPVLPTSFTLSAASDVTPVTGTLVGGTATGLSAGDVLQFTFGASPAVVYTLTVASVDDTGLEVQFVERSNQVTGYAAGNVITATAVSVTSSKPSESSYTVEVLVPTLKTVALKAHGIPIYGAFPNGFYNAYKPLNYGGHNIRAPRDVGALMITFCLYPGTYQPSGHINVSRAREFYLEYECAGFIGSGGANTTGNLVVTASAINFLLISDGSAVLRYST